jgi:Serine dehydrogenase proteinase
VARAERKTLIEQIEETRTSRVVVYATGDRHPTAAQIGDDAIRPLYDHLREIGTTDKLDLMIYSRGGDIDVPWRIATAFRSIAPNWSVLIPFRANSAATLLALGADEIVMGPQAELGPIDPIMNITRVMAQPRGPATVQQESVNVEDIMAYLRFARERGGLEAQEALSASLGKLADRLDPVALGNVYRTHSHIREVANRMISSRAEPPEADVTSKIVETLAEKTYAHGHAIGRAAAVELGLPVVEASTDLDALLWDLLGEYEDLMKLRDPMDPAVLIRSSDEHREAATIAVIESAWGTSSFNGEVEVRATRAMPQNLQVAVNLNLQVPPDLPPASQQAIQQFLAASQQAIVQQAQQAVQDALKQQAPVTNIEVGFRGGKWEFAQN